MDAWEITSYSDSDRSQGEAWVEWGDLPNVTTQGTVTTAKVRGK